MVETLKTFMCKEPHEKNAIDLKEIKDWCKKIPFFKEIVLKDEKLGEEDYLELAKSLKMHTFEPGEYIF